MPNWIKTLLKPPYKKSMLWLMQTNFYWEIIMRIIPFVRFSTYYTSFRGWKYQRGYLKLKKGDIVLSKDRKKLTTLLIPGEMTHAALCVDNRDMEWEISEMTHTDYTKSHFFDMCKEADKIIILRCRDWDKEYIDNVLIPTCISYQDAKYDVTFDLGVKCLYCSELVYQSDIERRLKCSLEDLEGLGRPYISPTGLLHAENVDIIWDSDKEVDPFNRPWLSKF